MASTILDHFDALTQKGLKVILLRENSKIPLCKGWNKNWDKEEARSKLKQYPKSNLGVLLGDIIDVEGDSDEANRTILDLIGDYPHPTYCSTKSIHHLFKTPDSKLSHFRHSEIEFRGSGHQSVIPPSQHQGVKYCWLKTFKFPIPEMPDKLYNFYLSKKNNHKKIIKPNHKKVYCNKCQNENFIHTKRLDLEIEVFRLLQTKWLCQNCREIDIRPACRLIKSGLCEKLTKLNGFSPF